MKEDTASSALHGCLYRSEAFAEDLEGMFEGAPQFMPAPERPVHAAWFFMLPLALVLLGSASALAWV